MPDKSVYEQISKWLDLYHATEDAVKRSKLKSLIVMQMVPVVKNIARTIARRSTDPIEDMVQAGYIGLLKAIDKYSKEKNDNFKVYAGYFIIGEMKHYLRDKLSAIRVPAYIQELSVRIQNFTNSLTQDELEKITTEYVASALNIKPNTVDYAMQMERRRTTVSFEDIFNSDSNDSLSFEELIASNDSKEDTDFDDIKMIFDNLIDLLPDEEKICIEMYYKQEMSKKEIADALQVTQMLVVRRVNSGLKSLSKLAVGILKKKKQ